MDDLVKKIVSEIMAEFGNRKGFDWWWEGIDSPTRSDIKRKLAKRVKKALSETATA